jgi:hypothetical protein
MWRGATTEALNAGIYQRKDAALLYETTLHTNISRFETSVEVFAGDFS